MEYLEERYPEPALLPADPADRAVARLWIWDFDRRLGDDYYAARRGDDGAVETPHRPARGARHVARGPALPRRRRLRPRRHRLRALDSARAAAARRRPRSVRGARRAGSTSSSSARRSPPSSASSPRCEARRRCGLARGRARRRRSVHRRRARPERARARPHSRLEAARARLAAALVRPGDGRGARVGGRSPSAPPRGHRRRSDSSSTTAATESARCRRPSSPSSPATRGSRCCSAGSPRWTGELETGQVELDKVRVEFTPNLAALPTRDELLARLEDPELTILDVRRPEEYTGRAGSACDPRQGRIPGARHLEVRAALRRRRAAAPAASRLRELVGLPEGAEIVAYCHSGSRSASATLALRAAGLPGAQLRRLVARVVAPPRAARRTRLGARTSVLMSTRRSRPRRGRPRRGRGSRRRGGGR